MIPKPDRYNGEYLELLRRVIQASGMTTGDFARTVLIRDEHTVRRWLGGERPMPPVVVNWLLATAPKWLAGKPETSEPAGEEKDEGS